MFNVYQPWDPLKVCVVGRSYPPEFFSWIQNTRARSAMEKVAEESEEDFQLIIKKLESFGVEVLRPNLPKYTINESHYPIPPVVPRDFLGMIGTTFYESKSFDFKTFYQNVKDVSWPDCSSMDEFYNLPNFIQQECYNVHHLDQWIDHHNSYNDILDYVRSEGNMIKSHVRDDLELCNTAQLRLLGHDLVCGTWLPEQRPAWGKFSLQQQQEFLDTEFTNTTNHIVDTKGHADSCLCPIAPGLILSIDDYDFTSVFKDWEVLHISATDPYRLDECKEYKKIKHKWRIVGFDQDAEVVDIIESKLTTWTGNSAETVFDIGMLHIDEKNVLTFGNHEPTLNFLERRGITVHQIPFRHRWFWDGGVHCVTCDIHRDGAPRKILS